MTTITGGEFNNAGTDFSTIVTSDNALTVGELETFLGTGADSITGFTGVSGGWTFTLDGVNFKLTTGGALTYQPAGESYYRNINPSTPVGMSDGLTATEITAFNNLINTHSTSTTGEDDGIYIYQPKTLFQKMLHTISALMNEMFLEILSMSTVLANGTGLEGIQLLAKKGITIDGVSIASLLDNAETTLMNFGEMIEHGTTFTAITTIPDTATATGDACDGEYDTIRLTFPDGGYVDLDLEDTGLSFVITPPADSDDPFTTDNIQIKLTDHESILESPGTLFLVQQLLQQMKDAMQAIGAVGKVGGDVRTTAVQSFVRDMNG